MAPTRYDVVFERLPKHCAELYEEGLQRAKVESIDHSGENVVVVVSQEGNPGAKSAPKMFQSIGLASRDQRHDLDSMGLKGSDRGAHEVHRRGLPVENA